MQTLKILATLTALWLISPITQAQDYRTFYKQAVQAYDSANYEAYLENMEKVAELLPSRPRVMWGLAGPYALNNKQKEAFATLKQLVWLMPSEKLASDKDFASISGEKEFQNILEEMKEMQQETNLTTEAFTLTDINLHPEGLAYNPKTGDFYCSSIRQRKIVKISADGKISDFISSGQDGIWAVSGIKIDEESQTLWASSAVAEQMADYDTTMKRQTGLFSFDLATGKLKRKIILPDDGKPHYFGDLAIHPTTKDIYLTDSYQPQIYRLKAQSEEILPFAFDKRWTSMQGICFSEDGENLFTSDYRTNVFKIDLMTIQIHPIVAPDNITLAGIDGLYLKGNALFAIHNGIQPFRVVKYTLDKKLEKVKKHELIANGMPSLNEPTLGVFAKNSFYFIANSPWGAYNRNGEFLKENVTPTKILKYQVD